MKFHLTRTSGKTPPLSEDQQRDLGMTVTTETDPDASVPWDRVKHFVELETLDDLKRLCETNESNGVVVSKDLDLDCMEIEIYDNWRE